LVQIQSRTNIRIITWETFSKKKLTQITTFKIRLKASKREQRSD
jgi:hypothetical protein